MSIWKKPIFKNIIAAILPQAVNIVSNFILPPLIIAAFGSATNGLVSTIKQLISYAALVGAGISASATQALYEPISNKDSIRVSGMIKSIDRMFCRVGYLYIVIIIILALIYPFVVKGNLSYISTFFLILAMSVSGASDFFFAGKYRTLLYANRRMYVQSIIQAVGLVVGLVSAIVLLRLGAGIVFVQLAMSMLYVVRIIGMHMYIKWKMPQYIQIDVPYIDEAVAKRNDAMLHQFTGLAVTSSQTIILSSFVGLEAASIYAVYNIIFSGLLSICAQISTAIAPFLGRDYALHNYEHLKKQYDTVEFVFNTMSTFVLGVASAMVIPFITLYTKDMDINYVDILFSQLFVWVTFFNIIRLPAQQLINVAGHFRETRSRAVIEAVTCIFLQMLFVSIYGLHGVLIGIGMAMGWRCVDIICYSNKYILKTGQSTSILRLIKAIISILIIWGISIYILPCIKSWKQWVISSIWMSFFAMVVIFMINIIFEYRRTKKYLQMILKW